MPGCHHRFRRSARHRKFAVERAVFLTVLHRLFVSGSDRSADRWCEDYAITDVEALDLHHLYRAMAWLGEELERQLSEGDKALVGNTGYRRYLKVVRDDHFAIDPDRVEEDKKFDGIFVLRTNIDLNPLDAMDYKQLCIVDQTFRTAKHLLSTRPIFHKFDETIRGHVFCSFLALAPKKALEDRLAKLLRVGSWPETIADLDSLTETKVEQESKRFVVGAPPRPAASLAIRAVGVALPPTVRQVD